MRREERLAEERRYGHAAEKVAEDIVADLLTDVLDWQLADLNHQLRWADIVLTQNGFKHMLVETKRPGALAWNRGAVELALAQALGYAADQHVTRVAVSDGVMLYAADVLDGGLRDRVFLDLRSAEPPVDLWWISVHGIYRPRADEAAAGASLLPAATPADAGWPGPADGALLHPHYKLPAACFAYVGHPGRPSTWHLPYRKLDGTVDGARLPKAIQAILSNYRGAKVSAIPEAAIPAVLRKLAEAAAETGRMPDQAPGTAPVYRQLADALAQLGPAS